MIDWLYATSSNALATSSVIALHAFKVLEFVPSPAPHRLRPLAAINGSQGHGRRVRRPAGPPATEIFQMLGSINSLVGAKDCGKVPSQ